MHINLEETQIEMDSKNGEIDISLILNTSEYFGTVLSTENDACQTIINQRCEMNTSVDSMDQTIYSRKGGKVDTETRRARNVISSRKYRQKRREKMQKLEDANLNLKNKIDEAESSVSRLKKVFYAFVQHASACQTCGDLKVKFD